MLERTVITAPAAGLDVAKMLGYHQSLAIRVGNLIFVSGMLAIDPETGEQQQGTVTSECHRIFKNLRLVLESAGSSLASIVQIRACIYDRIEYEVLNSVYAQYLGNEPPARTVWSVKIALGFKVQLDVIATIT